jgi:hypothetical protein
VAVIYTLQHIWTKLVNIMLNRADITARLQTIGLSNDEAKIYLELLKKPHNHLQLSRVTGIDRAKIYRMVERLEKRSLITRYVDDLGTFLMAADPSTLEVELLNEEQKLAARQEAYRGLLPDLQALQAMTAPGLSPFQLRTYEGQSGFKQMCWHELKTVGEIITFGHGNIETLVDDSRWATKHRLLQVEARYHTRDIVNEDKVNRSKLANEKLYDAGLYSAAAIPAEILRFDDQTVVYNDTVSIYHWQEGHRVGVEIVSATYAAMARQMFELYWKIAKKISIDALL